MAEVLRPHTEQRPLSAVPKQPWDVVIVGAGPTGSTAAVRLASLGHHVLLVDKRRFPREKVCGDGLVTDALNCLQRMGLRERVESLGHQSTIGRVFSRSRIEYEFSLAPFVAIKRERLDSLVAEKAVQSGAIFAQGAIVDISMDSDGSMVRSTSASEGAVRARVVVLATGADTQLPQRAGMGPAAKATHVASRCYVRSSSTVDCPVMSYDKSILPGCAWIFPLGQDEYNVGYCIRSPDMRRGHIRIQETFKRFLSDFPLTRQLMDHASHVTPLKGSILRTGLKGVEPYVDAKGLLAIGEAIGTTLPLSGEGIGKAMESGELAAEVIHHALLSGTTTPLRQFPAVWETRTKPHYVSYGEAERWIIRPWWNDLIAFALKKNSGLRNDLAGVLRETVAPRAVFSVGGLLKSVWT